jgi:transcriptional regulator with XRE-family HTH domain
MSLTPPTGTELRLFREGQGLTQAALAEKLGASRRTVEDWEAGRRLPPPLLRLALAAIVAGLDPWGLLNPVHGRVTRPGGPQAG